jgi:hypothetical protein
VTRRTTQLRAQFDVGGDRMRVVWVVTRPGLRDELIADAMPELADLLVDHGLQATSSTWVVLYGGDGVWLRADLRVAAWSDPRRDQDRRATTPADNH